MGNEKHHRIVAIDWMRGFVMVLMAIDHASQTWNAGRLSGDSAYLLDPTSGTPVWIPGSELDGLQFATRWITHLCAPTFLFLSGTSLAMSLEKRRDEGASERALDRHLFVRALVILAFEGLLSLMAAQGVLILQVLFAIGTSMIAMIGLRRLPTLGLVSVAIGWLVVSEPLLLHFFPTGAVDRPLWQLLFFVPAYGTPVTVIYPMTHWLAMMLLGWAFGRWLLKRPAGETGSIEAEGLLLLSGLSGLALFGVLRRINLYGNMALPRDDGSLIQWLHVSKYPPALTFVCLELGLMALFLLLFMRRERRLERPANAWNPLLVFGQTALFFYILHFILLGGSARSTTGGMILRGLSEAWIAAVVVLIVLYPICIGFRALKRRYPDGILQYI
jgi:uncharacterized membrane protein